jgi:endonuclease/exonuclease/phosphatase family metal-dependent hydrolase
VHEEISVGTFNIHGGIDGWGREFDVVEAARQIDADVLILEENVAIDGAPSIAEIVADALGYTVTTHPFTDVRLVDAFAPRRDEPSWGPPGLRPDVRAIRYAERGSVRWRQLTDAEQHLPSRAATLGLAVLARIEHDVEVAPLPRLLADPTRRALISMTIPLGNGTLRVAGTHLGHLTHGSPRQMNAIRSRLRNGPPTILGGDFNCWGPLLVRFLPGMRRAVLGPTWPAWRPRHQIDHLLVSGSVEVVDTRIFEFLGSDHLAVRAAVRLAEPSMFGVNGDDLSYGRPTGTGRDGFDPRVGG